MGYTVVMHIESVPNRDSHPTILLRQSYREGNRVRKRTIANLTPLPPDVIEILRRALRGEKLVPCDRPLPLNDPSLTAMSRRSWKRFARLGLIRSLRPRGSTFAFVRFTIPRTRVFGHTKSTVFAWLADRKRENGLRRARRIGVIMNEESRPSEIPPMSENPRCGGRRLVWARSSR